MLLGGGDLGEGLNDLVSDAFSDFVEVGASGRTAGGEWRGCGSRRGFGLLVSIVDNVIVLVFFTIAREIGIFPGVGVERSFVGGFGIENYVAHVGIEVGACEVGAGDLQAVEQEAGSFAVDLAGDDEAHDLHEGDLDGVGVLEDGEFDDDAATAGAVLLEAVEVELKALLLVAFVEVTEFISAQGGRSALGAVDLDVLTSIGKVWHVVSYPPSSVIYWNHRVGGILGFNLWGAMG